MKLIDKLNAEVKENIKSSKSSKKLLFRFKAEHYKKKMSTPIGFGFNDLKPAYIELYLKLVSKYKGELITELEDASKKQIALYFKA